VADAPLGLFVVGRLDMIGTGVVAAQAPLGDVEVMGADVGHPATGILLVIAPGGEVFVYAAGAEDRMVSPLGCRAQPELPIQPGLHRLRGQVAGVARAAESCVHGEDPAQASATDVLTCRAELAV